MQETSKQEINESDKSTSLNTSLPERSRRDDPNNHDTSAPLSDRDSRSSEVPKSTFTASKRVLIVDDNEDLAKMLSMLLSSESHQVRIAHDGKTGIEMAKEFHPQVCVCDIGLPEMTGHELAGHLSEILPDATLIALTGWGQDEDRRRSQEAGFHHHVVKGADLEELRLLVAEG